MRCPHCNGEHPVDFKFCPKTGREIVPQLKACTNADCPEYGKPILSLEAKFCSRCGKLIEAAGNGRPQKKRQETSHSQIVVVCSKAGSFIQIGRWLGVSGFQREKRIRLRKGENVICVEDYPELQYGFSFDRESDKPEKIEDIVLGKYDTSNVTDMDCMFLDCRSLTSLDLSGFSMSKVTKKECMFKGCPIAIQNRYRGL